MRAGNRVVYAGAPMSVPSYQGVIAYRAAVVQQEIEEMADKALLDLGFTPEFVRRSRGQKRRYQQRKGGNNERRS